MQIGNAVNDASPIEHYGWVSRELVLPNQDECLRGALQALSFVLAEIVQARRRDGFRCLDIRGQVTTKQSRYPINAINLMDVDGGGRPIPSPIVKTRHLSAACRKNIHTIWSTNVSALRRGNP